MLETILLFPACDCAAACSDYPLDSLDIPAEAAEQKLSSWQETHARLVLQQVPQLQDLRFVLCPK
jgi:hypothetical protein